MAGARDLTVFFEASGGHAGVPQTTGDPILAAGHFVKGLQQAVARAVNPYDPPVATVAMIRGGNSHNIIPGQVRLQGTLRAFDDGTLELLARRLETVAAAAAEIASTKAVVGYEDFVMPPVTNTPVERDLMWGAAGRCGVPTRTRDTIYGGRRLRQLLTPSAWSLRLDWKRHGSGEGTAPTSTSI
ncbi:peptidase dimerization domain-containing protein [Sinorhizobium meliloti]|uniref:peptidase dimerization domain-containing protein n=1 Tax=Rhizobium meliloti TaxID=382 RepID=UPI003F165FA5